MGYEHSEEVTLRLADTVVMYEGHPYYVSTVSTHTPDENHTILGLKELPSFKLVKNVLISDRALTYRKFNLGFCNVKNSSVFVQRIPVKKWKQGLNNDNVSLTDVKYVQTEPFSDNEIGLEDYYDGSFATLIRTKAFVNMMTDTYPTFKYCIDYLDTPGNLAIAFNKDFCIINDKIGCKFLLHQLTKVARIEGTTCYLPSPYRFLSEALNSLGVEIKNV